MKYFSVEQKMKRISLIGGFQNMWVFYCNGIFHFTVTLDLYIVKHCKYTRWNIFGGTKNKPNSLNRGFPKYVGDFFATAISIVSKFSTFDPYIVKHRKYTCWNIIKLLVETSKEIICNIKKNINRKAKIFFCRNIIMCGLVVKI